MKRNRYIIAYVLLAFCFIKHPVVGQNRSFTGTVTIHPYVWNRWVIHSI